MPRTTRTVRSTESTATEPRIRRFNKGTGKEVGYANSGNPTILLVSNDQITDAWNRHLDYVEKRKLEYQVQLDNRAAIIDARQDTFWHKATQEEVAQVVALMESLKAARK